MKRLEKEKKAQKLIESEGVRLSREDAADIQAVMEENSDKGGDFAKDSFQHILWEQLSLRDASSTAYPVL